jgi:hypothetical protein
MGKSPQQGEKKILTLTKFFFIKNNYFNGLLLVSTNVDIFELNINIIKHMYIGTFKYAE